MRANHAADRVGQRDLAALVVSLARIEIEDWSHPALLVLLLVDLHLELQVDPAHRPAPGVDVEFQLWVPSRRLVLSLSEIADVVKGQRIQLETDGQQLPAKLQADRQLVRRRKARGERPQLVLEAILPGRRLLRGSPECTDCLFPSCFQRSHFLAAKNLVAFELLHGSPECTGCLFQSCFQRSSFLAAKSLVAFELLQFRHEQFALA